VPQRTHTDTEIVERCISPLMNEGIGIREERDALRVDDVGVLRSAG
jgi:hypothetical protein